MSSLNHTKVSESLLPECVRFVPNILAHIGFLQEMNEISNFDLCSSFTRTLKSCFSKIKRTSN